jgi:hypothetical protein
VQRRETGIWQRRFWEHVIRDDADFERHVDYIHFNPVKHRHVTRVCDWPYSSFHRYVKDGLLPADWGGDVAEIQGRFGELSIRAADRVRKIALRPCRVLLPRERFCAPYGGVRCPSRVIRVRAVLPDCHDLLDLA